MKDENGSLIVFNHGEKYAPGGVAKTNPDPIHLRYCWLPIPLYLAAIIALKVSGGGPVYEPPFLLGLLNFIFHTVLMLCIAVLAWRRYVDSPSMTILFLGCGCLCLGIISSIAALSIHLGQVNIGLTIYNSGILITASCMLFGAHTLKASPPQSTEHSGWIITTSYSALLAVILLLTLVAWLGKTPPFFIQGLGGTPLRQIVLGLSVGSFTLAGILIRLGGEGLNTRFMRWYASGLGVFACGLFALFLSTHTGSLLSWTGRSAQHLGALFIFIATVNISRHRRNWEFTLQQALRESEERLRLAVQSAQLGVYSTDFLTGEHDFSTEFQQIYGLQEEETLPLKDGIPAAIHPDDQPRIFTQAQARRQGRLPPDFKDEYRIIRPDGTVRWIQATGRIRTSPAGEALGTTGIIMDITERKEAEQAIRHSERHLRDILDNLVALVGVLTPDGILIEANRAALSLAGLNPNDVLGLPFEETYWWSWSPGAQQRLLQTLEEGRQGKICRHDAVIRISQGKLIPIDFMLAPLYDESGKLKYLLPSAIDITDRQQAMEEQQRLITELEAANKELKGFTYSVSHDLRAPLRHMNSFAHLLKNHSASELDSQGQLYLDKVIESSQKMAILIDELLEFSQMRDREMKRQPVDLNLIVAETRNRIRANLGSRKIDWRIAELPLVQGDATMLQLVFWNLLDNALKFTAHRDTALIEIDHEATEEEHIISVKDNGVGFDMLHYDKLFGIFQTLHSHGIYKGTGIGLANTARILERHGGRIWAEGEPDKGATFHIALPREKK